MTFPYGQADQGNGIAVDSAGNAYITGFASSSDFPTKNALQSSTKCVAAPCTNAFVTEVNPTATAIVFSTYLGGSTKDAGTAISVNAQRKIFVTGTTTSTDFPTHNAFQKTLKSPSGGNAFVTKLSPDGKSFEYSTFLGGTTGDAGLTITSDPYGNAYVSGLTKSLDFPIRNAFQPQLNSLGGNAFITKLDRTGCRLILSSYLGGSNSSGDSATGIALGKRWSIWVVGNATSADFPITPGAFQKALKAPSDPFLTKIRPY